MGKRILVVDDAAFMRMMLKNILAEGGYEIAGEAENGRRAVELYRELRPDAVKPFKAERVLRALEKILA